MTLKNHVVISKSIHVLWISLLIYYLFSRASQEEIIFQISNKKTILEQSIIGILLIGLPIYFLYKSFFPTPKFKYKLIQPEINYHPFYLDYIISRKNYKFDLDDFQGYYLFAGLIAINFSIQSADGPDLYLFIFVFGICWRIIEYRRKSVDWSLMYTLIYNTPITLEAKYYSYLKDRSKTTFPFLEIGQVFDCEINKIPRNRREARTIFIYNNNHPNKNYLIAKIEISELARLIRDGKKLTAKIIDIKPYAKLHIQISVSSPYF